MKKFSIILVVLSVASLASASIPTISYTSTGIPGDLTQYIFSVHADTDNPLYTLGLDFSATPPGFLNQEKFMGFDTPDLLYVSLLIEGGKYDSHINFLPTDLALIITLPAETPTTLVGKFGFAAGSITTTTPIAQIVAPTGQVVDYSIMLGYDAGGGQGGVVDLVGEVPEPATLSLLVLGGIGVLLRRRRK